MSQVAEDHQVHPSAVALMDATDSLLGEVGYSELSSRKITERAGLAHGSIRYHFGSMQQLVVATVGRRNEEMYERQRALYESGKPTREIWGATTGDHFEADLDSGWSLRLVEALMIGMRHPDVGAALQQVLEPWRELIRQATHDAVAEYDLDIPPHLVDGISALIETSQLGMLMQRLAGNDKYHDEALEAMDALFRHLETRKAPRGKEAGQ